MTCNPAVSPRLVSPRILNLIDVATKLSSFRDPPYHIPQFFQPDSIIPRMTPWDKLSHEQILKIFNLMMEYYRDKITNPDYDPDSFVGPEFIKNRYLRKKSSEFSRMLIEGAVSAFLMELIFILSIIADGPA